jgi:hypothetical protein
MRMPPVRRTLAVAASALALSATAMTAHAQGMPLDDGALSDVWGQALLTMTNTSVNGYDFSRITLGADIDFNANFTNVQLGGYSYSARNGTGYDIDIGKLQFGRSDGTDAQRTVHITDPYFEFVYQNAGSTDASQRNVVGMRLGFGSIQGDIGIQMNAVSGSLLINAGSSGTIDSHNDPLGGKRWDGTQCNAGATCPLALSQIGLITAGDATGASRDFFISVLNQAVQFPAVNGISSDTAQPGFWLNWRDRLTAGNLNQAPPPNLPKSPGG